MQPSDKDRIMESYGNFQTAVNTVGKLGTVSDSPEKFSSLGLDFEVPMLCRDQRIVIHYDESSKIPMQK